MFGKTFVILDIETTGVLPEHHEIIEIGAVKIKQGKITGEFQTMVKPQHKIPPFIENLTKITDEMVVSAPDPDTAAAQLKKFIGKNTIVGHNVEFDLGFINCHLKSPLGNMVLDTCHLARIFLPFSKSHSLSKLSELLNITHQEKHRALDDALAAADLLMHIFDLIKSFDIDLLLDLQKVIGSREMPFVPLIEEQIKLLSSKFPDAKVNSKFTAIGREDLAQGLFVVPEERVTGNFPSLLDYKHMKELFKPSGLLAKEFPAFEFRPQQEKILLDISRAYNENKFLLLEAGTGTGKSLAYLIPSIYWSAYNREKIVIATHTISLQEQLWEKDIPLIKNILNIDFQTALVKGRNNYICLRKWDNLIEDNSYNSDEALFYLRLLIWLKSTQTGDKSELNLYQTEKEAWVNIAAESDTCLGPQCPWFDKYCFVMRARNRAEAADLLIINHSLLFSDIKTENRVLPPFGMLVIDEAHHLEDGATDHLGYEVSTTSVKSLLNGLHRQSGGSPGLLKHLKNKLEKHLYSFEKNDFELINQEIEKAVDNIYQIREKADLFFRAIIRLDNNENRDADEFRATFRLKSFHKEMAIWPEVESQRANLHTNITYLIENLKKIINIIERRASGEEELLPGEKKDLLGIISSLKNIMSVVDLVVEQQEKNHVFWVEYNSLFCSLRAAPVNVGEILYGNLLQNKKSIIFTSATLTVDGNFDHFIERSGLNLLEPDKFITSKIDSPFEFERQALICAINNLPDPNGVEDETYSEAIAPFLSKLFQATKGSTMVLFTSHKMLKETYYKLKPTAEKNNINLLADGIDGGRERIINLFRENNNSVLFGANSFWEGIDLPGDLLKCVVIVKIPFWPPAIPTIEARLEELAGKNIDGFWNFTVPQAVIRLKQGFGRLIRTQKDRGVVIILDNRIITKKYGYKFLRSLPLKRHFKGDQDIVIDKVYQWLSGDIPEVNLNVYNTREQITGYLKNLNKGNK